MQLPHSLNYLLPYQADLVRVGPLGDCGYVIPVSVARNTKGLYSVGISTNWQFEVDMKSRNKQIKIRAFDRTSGWSVFAYIALRDLFRGDPSESEKMSANARVTSALKYLGLAIRFRIFFSGRRRFKRRWVRLSSNDKSEVSFQDSIQELLTSDDVMIKIDIEGGEYEIAEPLIDCIEKNSENINCVVMEFHDTRTRRTDFEKLVRRIAVNLPIVHIHGNNCVKVADDGLPEVIEITFARDCTKEISKSLNFPLPGLDAPNDESLPDISFSLGLVT